MTAPLPVSTAPAAWSGALADAAAAVVRRAKELAAAGARDVRRLQRGCDFDRIERIFQGDPHARLKYGAGEYRFVFTR